MRKQATIGALLLIAVGVTLGATVFRTDIAQATGLAQSVTVTNTPLPVREQNLDGGNIKVHEQGTANVNVTNSSLSVAPAAPITNGGDAFLVGSGASHTSILDVASALSISMTRQVVSLELRYQGNDAAVFDGPFLGGNPSVELALTRPIKFDEIVCNGPDDNTEFCTVSWVGAQP